MNSSVWSDIWNTYSNITLHATIDCIKRDIEIEAYEALATNLPGELIDTAVDDAVALATGEVVLMSGRVVA